MIIIFLAVSVVLSGFPDPKALQKEIFAGLTHPSTNLAHSFYYKSIPCEKVYDNKKVDIVEQWKKYYKKLEEKGAFLPKVLTDFKKADDKENCFIFFKNLFASKVEMYRNLDLLIVSLKKFVEALNAAKIYGDFDITYSSFAYEPSTRRYVFIDIDKLEQKQPNLRLYTPSYVFGSFLKSLIKRNINLTKNQLDDLKRLGGVKFDYPSELIYETTQNQLTLVKDINSYRTENPYSPLIVEMDNKKGHFDLKVSYAGNKISFDQIQLKDSLSIYLCRLNNNSYDLKCSNIDERNSLTKFTKKFYLPKDQVVEFEVQESIVQHNRWYTDEKKPIFYEIFIIAKPKNAVGLLKSKTYYTANSPFELTDKDLFFCETNDNKLHISYINDHLHYSSRYNIQLTELNPEILDRIIQVSPHHRKSNHFSNTPVIKRVFYLPELKKKSIFVYDHQTINLKSILTHKLEFEILPLFVVPCNDSFLKVFFSADPSNLVLEYNSEKQTYPSPIKFSKNNYFCLKEIKGDVLTLGLDQEKLENERYVWNFNTCNIRQGKKSNKSCLIYIQRNEDELPNFEFTKFAWPIASLEVVYISIRRFASDQPYFTQVVYFKEDNILHNIIYNKKFIEIDTPKLPVNFVYNEANDYWTTKLVKRPFKEYDAVYLSDSEIVYQVEIPGFQKCHPILKLENEDTIRIWCESSMFGYTHPKPYDSKTPTDGLNVVEIQGNPKDFGEVSNSNVSNEKQKRSLRVLI